MPWRLHHRAIIIRRPSAIRHLLSTELAVILACSLILTRLDSCNSVLDGAPAHSLQLLQRVQNNAVRIVLQAPRRSHAQPLLRELHPFNTESGIRWLCWPSRVAAAPTYHSRHIKARVSERTLRSSAVPLLDKPFARTDFARRSFRCSAPIVWNSLPETLISVDSLSTCI